VYLLALLKLEKLRASKAKNVRSVGNQNVRNIAAGAGFWLLLTNSAMVDPIANDVVEGYRGEVFLSLVLLEIVVRRRIRREVVERRNGREVGDKPNVSETAEAIVSTVKIDSAIFGTRQEDANAPMNAKHPRQ